jgi:hypothetical protein
MQIITKVATAYMAHFCKDEDYVCCQLFNPEDWDCKFIKNVGSADCHNIGSSAKNVNISLMPILDCLASK